MNQDNVHAAVQACSSLGTPAIFNVPALWFNAIEESLRASGYFVARIKQGVSSLDELIVEVYKGCQFPSWYDQIDLDVLKDGLLDLSWLSAPGFVLMFDNLRNYNDEEDAWWLVEVARICAQRQAEFNKVPLKFVFAQGDLDMDLISKLVYTKFRGSRETGS